MLSEILAFIVVYLGFFVGYYLSRIAKEEVAVGRRNLIIFQKTISFVILVWFLANSTISLLFKLILTAIFIINEIAIRNDYLLPGIVFGIMPDYALSSLIFIYGLPTGSLLMKDKIKMIFRKTIWFVVFVVLVAIVHIYA